MNIIEEYKNEIIKKIEDMGNCDIFNEIEEKVAEYRKSLENEIKENQSKELEKLNIELNCVNTIIEKLKEEAKQSIAPQTAINTCDELNVTSAANI